MFWVDFLCRFSVLSIENQGRSTSCVSFIHCMLILCLALNGFMHCFKRSYRSFCFFAQRWFAKRRRELRESVKVNLLQGDPNQSAMEVKVIRTDSQC